MNTQQCLNAIKINGTIRQIVEQLRSRCVHKINSVVTGDNNSIKTEVYTGNTDYRLYINPSVAKCVYFCENSRYYRFEFQFVLATSPLFGPEKSLV